MRIGPSGGEVAAVGIGIGAAVGAVIGVEVHHAHHTIDGCVSGAPGDLQLTTHKGAAAYQLQGQVASLSAGQRVRLHGSHAKQTKGSTAEPTFLVESTSKTFGPCKAQPTAPPSAP